METSTITVVGDGGWGTALAILLCEAGHEVRMWSVFPRYLELLDAKRENEKFLPGVEIPEAIRFVPDRDAAFAGAHLIIGAVPTRYLRSVLEAVAPSCSRGIPWVTVAKGIEDGTLMRGSQIIADVLGPVKRGVLSGPSHAEEVARRLPTTVVASSEDEALAERIQAAFMTEHFRVYTNPDVIGVELGGALKNVIAVAAGICDGLEFGDNTKAALVTRGLTEISRLGEAMGARRSTFFGLSGIGDLITTCFSPYGRNRSVGQQIGRGRSLAEILEGMEQVAEGVITTKSAKALAEKQGVEMPITEQTYRVLYENQPPREAVRELMLRGPKAELEELG